MSSKTLNFELESPIPAAKFYKAALFDWHKLAAKLVPEIFASSTALEGDGGVGSINQYNFTQAMPFSFTKERVDVANHEKLEYKETLIEGGDLGKKIESMCYSFKVEPSRSGGCVCKIVVTYKTLPGVDYSKEEKTVKDGLTGALKAAEGYLLANPSAYA